MSRRKRANAPKPTPAAPPRRKRAMSGLMATKLHIGFIGSLLFIAGTVMGVLVWWHNGGLTLIGVGAFQGVIGLALLVRAYTAKNIDDFSASGF